jgi:hypothetical protein
MIEELLSFRTIAMLSPILAELPPGVGVGIAM